MSAVYKKSKTDEVFYVCIFCIHVHRTALDFILDIKLEENSTRFPEDIKVNYKIPHFSSLDSVDGTTTYIDSETLPSDVDTSGIDFLV